MTLTFVPLSMVGLARKSGLLFGVVVAALLIGCSDLQLKEISELQCEDLVSEIIDLSKEGRNPLAPTILKISNTSETTRTSTRLECIGDAKWSSGEGRVAFHVEDDADGDRFIGYQRR